MVGDFDFADQFLVGASDFADQFLVGAFDFTDSFLVGAFDVLCSRFILVGCASSLFRHVIQYPVQVVLNTEVMSRFSGTPTSAPKKKTEYPHNHMTLKTHDFCL